MPNISRGRVATQWFLTREERKKEARQVPALVRLDAVDARDCRPWSAHEDFRVRVAYKRLGSRALAAELGRYYKTVQNRARVLGVAETRT